MILIINPYKPSKLFLVGADLGGGESINESGANRCGLVRHKTFKGGILHIGVEQNCGRMLWI